MHNSKVKFAVIGLGLQARKKHLKSITDNPNAQLVCACDIDENLQAGVDVPFYSDIDVMLNSEDIDAAIVCLPHHMHEQACMKLIQKGIHILKEKPFAINLESAIRIAHKARDHNTIVHTAVQRRHNPIFLEFSKYATEIGEIFSVHGHYTLNIDRLDKGWRSSFKESGGGAVMDMGYHIIDLITWFFDKPSSLYAQLGFNNRKEQSYDVEDTAKIDFSFPKQGGKILCSLMFSRIYPKKEEMLSIYGSKGTIRITNNEISLEDQDKRLIKSYTDNSKKEHGYQVDNFIQSILDHNPVKNIQTINHQLKNMSFIDAVYRSDDSNQSVSIDYIQL